MNGVFMGNVQYLTMIELNLLNIVKLFFTILIVQCSVSYCIIPILFTILFYLSYLYVNILRVINIKLYWL